MEPDDFVAVGIAQISEIHLPGSALTDARRVLDRRAAICDPGIVPCLRLLGAGHQEADRAAIGGVSRLAINRLCHNEATTIVRVSDPTPRVRGGGADAEHTKDRVVKFLRSSDVVAPDHDVAEHPVLSSSGLHVARRLRPTGSTRSSGCGQYDGAMAGIREESFFPSASPAADTGSATLLRPPG